jgi:tetratricopeptide (TPR) repeat protein
MTDSSIKGKKIKIFLRTTKKYMRSIVIGAVILGVFAVMAALPTLAFQTGNAFFGGVEPLYNVSFAQATYLIATHPLLPMNPPRYAHHQLSRTYFIQGDQYKALDEAREELALYPDDTSTYYILGLTYGYLGRTHEGIDAFSKYIETHPGTWAGRNDKAWLQFRIGDISGALATIEPIVQEFPYTPWVQNTYCTLLVNTTRYAEAESACAHAKSIIDHMTPEDWGHAYPGNDPRVYADGLDAMKQSIEQNIALVKQKASTK